MNQEPRHIATRRIGATWPIAVVGVLIAASIVVMTAPGQAASGSRAPAPLSLVVEFDRHANVRDDVAPEGDSQGDQVVYEMPVFAANNRTRLGRGMFLNTFQGDQGVLVAAALRLRSGTITLAGAHVNGAGNLAVTGGTGAYAGARGTYAETNKPLQVLGEDGPSRHRVKIVFTR